MNTAKPKTIAFFDFDGTISTTDSMLQFLLFALGKKRVIMGAAVLLPVITLYLLRIISNSTAKKAVLRHFFRNTGYAELCETADRFGLQKLPLIVRPKALERIKWHQANGHTVVVVSASIKLWLRRWCDEMQVELIATELQIENGRFAGSYAGANCNGEEKVRRIKAQFDLSQYAEIYAYGDSAGDLPMLAMAAHGYYKPFRD